VLDGLLTSGRIYLSKLSFYLGCVSRVAGAESGAEGCQAPLSHPIACRSPASPAAAEPSTGWPSREPVPWVATCPVCPAQAKLALASISRAALLLSPVSCSLCANNPGQAESPETPSNPLPALFETPAIQSSGISAFTCGKGTPRAPCDKQSSASALGFFPLCNVP